MNRKKKLGLYLVLIAGILSLAGCIAYTQVMYKLPAVFVLLILLAAVAVVDFVKDIELLNKIAPVITAFLASSAVIWAVNPMVNQIGYVVSGLDEIGTIIALIISGVFMALAMIASIVAAFMKQREAAEQ